MANSLPANSQAGAVDADAGEWITVAYKKRPSPKKNAGPARRRGGGGGDGRGGHGGRGGRGGRNGPRRGTDAAPTANRSVEKKPSSRLPDSKLPAAPTYPSGPTYASVTKAPSSASQAPQDNSISLYSYLMKSANAAGGIITEKKGKKSA